MRGAQSPAVPSARSGLSSKQLVVCYRSSKGIAASTQEELEARGWLIFSWEGDTLLFGLACFCATTENGISPK